MTGTLKVACVQVNAGPEIAPNLEAAGTLVRRARGAGADLIALPENVSMVVQGRAKVLERARPQDSHPAVPFFADLARETGATILAGSIAVLLEDGRIANRSLLFDPSGRLVAT